ncbi:S-layer homology domain-containing protein [uncultured Agathobaculum sp.]|uniref:S-layer homology domain-containing protein n=1 Tax=uncultured Agathobaculum sp. TaxID=2048140 RepID=UPI00296E6110
MQMLASQDYVDYSVADATDIATVYLGFKSGKSVSDLTKNSIRFINAAECTLLHQSSAIEITNGKGGMQQAFLRDGSAGTLTITPEVVWNDITPSEPAKPLPTCAAPTGVIAAFGSALSTITLTNPTGNTDGKWYWMNDTQKVGNVKDNPHTYKAKFVPNDTSAYQTVENIDVTVNATKVVLSSGSPIMIPIEETYTGSAIEPKPSIRVSDMYSDELVLNQDYEITKYENNTNVGHGKIFIAPLPNGNYDFTGGSYNFTIKAGTSSISITSAPGKTYDGSAVSAPVVNTTGSTGTVTFTYYTDAECTTETNAANSGAASNGAAPKNAGDYWVKATVAADGSYGSATSAAKKFTIARADYNYSYTGSTAATINQPRPTSAPATATGVGSESVSGTLSWYTDSGCTSPASGNFGTVGTEDLYWKFAPADPNYDTAPKTGKVTFVISALPAQTVTFATSSITKTFGDSSFTNAATSTDSSSTITYASDKPAVATVNASTGEVTIKGAGTAIITATAAATPTHAEGQASYTLTVSPKTITPAVTVTGTYTYNGDPITPTYTVEITSGTALPTDQYEAELTNNTDAGTAYLKIKAKAGGNYSFTVDQPFTIDQKKAPELTAKALDQFTLFGVGDFVEPIVYGVKGEVLEGTITYDVGGTDHYPNKAKVVEKLKTMAAGASLPLTYHFDPTSANYLGAKTGSFTITVQAKTDVSGKIAFSDGKLTYNGSAQTYEKASIGGITAGANPKWTYTYAAADATATLDSGKPKTAGTYTVTAVYEDDNNYGTKSATLTIKPQSVDIPKPDTKTYTYNGADQTYNIPSMPAYTVSGNTQKNANETGYTVTVALTDKVNTAWTDDTTADKTYTFKIMKALPTGAPTYTKINTSGKKLADAALAIGTIKPAGGTLVWDDGDSQTVAANTAYGWTYTPAAADAANYKKLTGSLKPYTVSSSGGGGGSYTPTYAINVDKTENGSITVSPKSASKGSTVTITVKPDKGYELDALKALDKDGGKLKLTEKNGKYTFTMPASKITISGSFVKQAETPVQIFDDVPVTAYYYEAVKWAADKNITGGIGNNLFAPDAACTRAQIVTFLWRAAGSPEPKTMRGFDDVSADAYYAKAVAWAIENGITAGTGEGRFSPDATCTRAQAVTFLYRASGASAVSGNSAFSDVAADAYYAAAVAWAEKNGVTGGIGGGLFGSDNTCTRAQIVTFLYRTMK